MIGSGGAGKTTLSVAIATATGLPIIHLDSLYWREGWEPTPAAEWEDTVADLVHGHEWIMDGNYGGTLELRIAAADSIIFLDMARITCLWRVLKRRVANRHRPRPFLPSGCREVVTPSFLWWIWTYRSKRRPKILAHLKKVRREKNVVILRGPEDVDLFLHQLSA